MLLTEPLQGSQNYPFQLVFPGMQLVKWKAVWEDEKKTEKKCLTLIKSSEK